MKPTRTAALNKILAEVQDIESLFGEADIKDALARLLRARAALRAAGLVSPWVTWQLAVAHDLSGDPLTALQHARDALELDPVCPAFRSSREVIVRRIAEALCAADRDAGALDASGLYRALQLEGAATEDCHLAMARHHLVHGNSSAALRVLDALLTLNPTNVAGWEAKAMVLEKTGKPRSAAKARAEAHQRNAKAASELEPTQREAQG